MFLSLRTYNNKLLTRINNKNCTYELKGCIGEGRRFHNAHSDHAEPLEHVGRPEYIYRPKRHISEYPVPSEALSRTHMPKTYVKQITQEISRFQIKPMYAFAIHLPARMWFGFSTIYWMYTWPVMFTLGLFYFSYFWHQRLMRIRTWN